MTVPVIDAANNHSITQHNINQHREQWRRFCYSCINRAASGNTLQT
jgi:hypothetical protein